MAGAAAQSGRGAVARGRSRGESPAAAPDALRPAGSVFEAVEATAVPVIGRRSPG